jgi:tetratricopeptide (TPR) repeat protein
MRISDFGNSSTEACPLNPHSEIRIPQSQGGFMLMRAIILTATLFLSSCAGVRSVQLQPPTPPPAGMIWGYGVEKLSGKNAERGRQSAYLKAMDDLLTRGPVLVSKVVQDRTTVVNVKPATRTLESTFRLRASRMLQPSFMQTGVEDGFVWVLVGTTEDDLERGWEQFVEWRSQKMAHAEKLFKEANGPDRLPLLKAAFALLDEAGAQDDPGMLYYQVKTAIEGEQARIAQLERFQRDFRRLTDSGQLLAADTTVDQALKSGLEQPIYQQCKLEIGDRRNQAAQLISAGDALFHDQEYKGALERYQSAQKLDRDNPQLPAKLAMADRYHREARGQNTREAVGFIVPAATRAVGEFFAYKREQERRKREEAEQAAEEARQEEIRREDDVRRREDARREEARREERRRQQGNDARGSDGRADGRPARNVQPPPSAPPRNEQRTDDRRPEGNTEAPPPAAPRNEHRTDDRRTEEKPETPPAPPEEDPQPDRTRRRGENRPLE